MIPLQSKDHKVIMDTIDRLRSKGISRYVDLPQIVVCGDQSSGKSSVLQAVSGMSFPTKDNLCTRFATELILRHTIEDHETCRVSIHPGADRSSEEKTKLEAFRYSEIPEKHNIAVLVDKAKGCMGMSDQSKTFSTDILRIELSGAAQPDLTIVDLPGLFLAGNKEQSAEDADIVRQLVHSYMANPLSIILAVVSAKNDFALQEVTQIARKVDPRGLRTMGLITKPDTLDVGSDSERSYFELAQNRDVHFRLGWHIVRNRDFQSRYTTNDERDRAEADFLSQGIWSALSKRQKGAAALRIRLSNVLTDQILDQLPILLSTIDSELRVCTSGLDKLGKSRKTLEEQRKYLLRASHQFSSLMKAAIDGMYGEPFFGNAKDHDGYQKRLRAVVQNTLTNFAETMRLHGHARKIVEGSVDDSKRISRDIYLQEVRSLMKRSRGCELPGTYNPLIVGELFHEQSKPWKGHIENYSDQILKAVDFSVNSVLGHVVDENTQAELWKGLINDELEGLKRELHAKSVEILALHTSGHPITYNHYLTEIVQKIRTRRTRNALKKCLQDNYTISLAELGFDGLEELLDTIMTETELNMETYACSAAVDMMEAYYKVVALKRVVDDFSDLAIEACLVGKLPALLTPERVFGLSDDEVQTIAAESGETTIERDALMEKFNVLSDGLSELRRLSRHHQPPSHASLESDTSGGAGKCRDL
ncbi:P-loop containing nucleoside triphosphate hydrolase protein [Xylariales sp. AK1849]|nr:P-loop containing nucleoside triphosphate hydrolase protein [Xylariales sp. AK1849]